MEYKKYKLGDICKIFGRIGFRGYTTEDLVSSPSNGAISLSPSNIVDGVMDLSKCTYISWEKYEESPEIKIAPNDIVIVKTGNSYGRTAIIRNVEHPMTLNPQFVVLKDIQINPVYLAYFLKTDEFQKQIYGIVGGSAIPTLSQEDLASLIVRVPNENIQNTIADILDSLDGKIEFNKQINDNLEAMAKQLYDYWFVQFDFPNEEGKPYKSSGGAMVYNERLKREIPVGWQVENLVDFAEIKNGATPSTSDDTNYGGDIVWITPKDLSDQQSKFVYQGERNITKQGLDSCSTSMLPINSVLMSSRAPIGLISIAKHEVCTNQGFKSFIPKNMEDSIYLYYYIKHHIKQIEQLGTGTTFKEVSRDDLCKFSILVVGANDAYKQWVELQDEIANKQFVLTKEIASLTKQRDELLPLLMNGQASVNYHLSASFLSSLILYRDQYKFYDMKETIVQAVLDGMRAILTENQLDLLTDVTRKALSECEITPKATEEEQRNKENVELLGAFISSKKVEGCSDKTIHYYKSSIEKLIATVKKNVCDIATNDIRCYLAEQQEQRGLSKVTIDNLRRIYSSFFSWLEDEDYITKSPVRRIHKVRTDALVKEVLTDENIEVLRDSCQELRDIAMIDLLLSTGMRVGELVKINREDIDFQERQCVVFGKGNKEREVYFNARTKIHLKKYLEQRTDTNPALFVSLHEPHTRLTISGVEVRLRQLGKKVNLNKVHPHKFRRTLATMAIDKGMPIEQVQKMLGHVKIDTTLHYAMVNQTNVKIAHRKFLN